MKKIYKLMISLAIGTCVLSLSLFGNRAWKSSFIVEPMENALIVQGGVVQELINPGLHIRFSNRDSVLFYPTQKVFKYRNEIHKIFNVSIIDSVKIVEVLWHIFEPIKYYEEFGQFDDLAVNHKIESTLLSSTDILYLIETEDDLEKLIRETKAELDNDINKYGIKIIKITYKSGYF